MSTVKRFTWSCLIAVIAFLILGNLFVLSASVWARGKTPAGPSSSLGELENFRNVDTHLWRGSAPGEDALPRLRAAGIRTIVDLRAEADPDERRALLEEHGLRWVSIPIRDGQAPAPAQVRRFLRVVDRAEGGVYVHCMAGVGRTGTMVAAYLVRRGDVDPMEAVEHNLSVGPPSLEQIAFAIGLESAEIQRPSVWITAASRVLDAPRRIWVNLRHYGADASSVVMLVTAMIFAWMLSKVESTKHPRSLLWA